MLCFSTSREGTDSDLQVGKGSGHQMCKESCLVHPPPFTNTFILDSIPVAAQPA